jgi:hypothetical protein
MLIYFFYVVDQTLKCLTFTKYYRYLILEKWEYVLKSSSTVLELVVYYLLYLSIHSLFSRLAISRKKAFISGWEGS